MLRSKKKLLVILFFIIIYLPGLKSVSADIYDNLSLQFPENTEVRRELYDIMTGPNSAVLSVLPEWKVIDGTGVRVNFFTEKIVNSNSSNVYFCFSHGSDLDFTKGTIGSYIIKRSLDDDDSINFGIKQIKIFYKN